MIPTDAPEPLLISTADAARLVSLSRSNVYKLVKTGQIPSIRIGGLIRVPVAKLREYIARQSTGGMDHIES